MPANEANSHPQAIEADSLHAQAATAADSVPVDTPYVARYPQGLPRCQGNDSIISSISHKAVLSTPSGPAPTPHKHSLLADTGTVAMMLAAILFIALSYQKGYKYIKNLGHNIFSVRRRNNVFDDYTVSETQILTALVLNSCVMQGIMLFLTVCHFNPGLDLYSHSPLFVFTGSMTAIALVNYLFQLMLYKVLGYVFTDRESATLLMNGYKASQSLLGLLLMPVVALSLSLSGINNYMLIAAAVIYICVRIVFICKGLRIFFTNYQSTLYFILYLCSVELVPLGIIYSGTVLLCNYILQS